MLMNKIKTRFSIRTMLFGLLACSMLSCSDDLDIQIVGITGEPHDPSKPIEVTDYSPKEGTAGQQMVVYGKNFGTDPSIIKVTVGGTEAVVVSANGEAIYCLLPAKSESDVEPEFNASEDEEEYSGTVSQDEPTDEPEVDDSELRSVYVAVGPQGAMQSAKAPQSFIYTKAWKVRTLVGTVNEKNENIWKDGPFDDCGNFWKAENFCIDPVNPNHLWISGDGPGDTGVRLVDLENETVTTLFKDPEFIPYPQAIRKLFPEVVIE